MKHPFDRLGPWVNDQKQLVNVVVETVKGSRIKPAFDHERRVFRLKKALPAGFSFPYDFGFVPGTRAGDGDPLDVLVLMDEPTFHGCLVEARPIGAVKMLKEDARNDRIIAVWPDDPTYGTLQDFTELPSPVQIAIERFFRLYPAVRGEKVEFLGCEGAEAALKLVKKNIVT